ncbi:Glycosyl transferase family 13, partial [Trinorchestia longiramus]
DVMGDFCAPAWKPFQSISLAGTDILEQVPIIVTAGQRPHYLYETIKSMFAAPGFHTHKVHVFVGNNSSSTLSLLDFFRFNYTVIQHEGTGNAMLFQYYRKVFTFITHFFPDAKAAIVLDEDVALSPDFFSYMSQVIPVLLQDTTLYCATAFGPYSKPGLNLQRDKVRRGETQVGWGYAIKMSTIKKALGMWPVTLSAVVVYDAWLYEYVVEDMECIFPELSRSKHFGIGINALGIELEHQFLVMQME